jgi:hypothetical protein
LWEIVKRLWEIVALYWHAGAHLHKIVTVMANTLWTPYVSLQKRAWSLELYPDEKGKSSSNILWSLDDQRNSCHLARTCCCSQAKSKSFKLNNSKFVVGCIEPWQKWHRSCGCGWIIVICHQFCGIKSLASDHFKTIRQKSYRKRGWVLDLHPQTKRKSSFKILNLWSLDRMNSCQVAGARVSCTMVD